jgi:hypothetical protein
MLNEIARYSFWSRVPLNGLARYLEKNTICVSEIYDEPNQYTV